MSIFYCDRRLEYPETWEAVSACHERGFYTVNGFAAFYLGWDDCLTVLRDLNETPIGLVGRAGAPYCDNCKVCWTPPRHERVHACPQGCGFTTCAPIADADLYFRILNGLALPLQEIRELRRVRWDMTGLSTEVAFRGGWDACLDTFLSLNDTDAGGEGVAAHVARIRHADEERLRKFVVIDECAEFTAETYEKLLTMISDWRQRGVLVEVRTSPTTANDDTVPDTGYEE